MKALMNDSVKRATVIGILAPVCWGMGVSLVRGIAEGFGLAQGQTLLYLTAAICLYFTIGFPQLSRVDKRYLFIGLPTANASSLCFVLAIYFSTGGTQTMEVAMVNYLWPSLTLLFAVLFNGVRTRWWIAPGIFLGFFGIIQILAGDQGFSLAGFAERLMEHPLSYVLAVGAALTWAGFSSMTRAWGGSTNLSTLIFTINTLIYGTLWILGFGTNAMGEISQHGIVSVIFGGIAMGGAYAAWTFGMSQGNVTVLAVASYFTPVLSCLFAVGWIDAKLDDSFWTGVALVVAGSLICWDATGRGMKRVLRLEAQGKTTFEEALWERFKAFLDEKFGKYVPGMKRSLSRWVPKVSLDRPKAAVSRFASRMNAGFAEKEARVRKLFQWRNESASTEDDPTDSPDANAARGDAASQKRTASLGRKTHELRARMGAWANAFGVRAKEAAGRIGRLKRNGKPEVPEASEDPGTPGAPARTDKQTVPEERDEETKKLGA